jgi:hypothetical protein
MLKSTKRSGSGTVYLTHTHHTAEPSSANIYPAMRVTAMTDGSVSLQCISDAELWEDYYIFLHDSYNAMRGAFDESGLTQDQLAVRLGVDKSLISRRLNGTENLTLKTMSHMGTAMGYRPVVNFVPFSQVGMSNYFVATPLHPSVGSVITQTSSGTVITQTSSGTLTNGTQTSISSIGMPYRYGT